jgi:o-succinylbenzoate---CoA ligase
VPVVPGDELAVLPQLRAALSGQGPALLPHPAARPATPALRPGEPLGPDEDDPQDPTAVVIATSGSTGAAKGVLLTSSALLASVAATHDRLGGPGTWLLALPVDHVAGVQVLVRSLVAGTLPTVLATRLGESDNESQRFVAATTELTGRATGRRYTALVPTQVVRLLEAGGAASEALAGYDSVLVGGAPLAASVRAAAQAAGVRLVTTYGMSETCGGCVYDGVPLPGVDVDLSDDTGRVRISGPVLARGYRHASDETISAAAAFTHDVGGRRWFTTDDLGRWDSVGGLVVLGRADDAVLTGGLTVAPAPVEAALLELASVAEAVVVGAPDHVWGQRMVAALVLRPGHPAPSLGQVRAHVAERVSAEAAPRQLLVLDHLPVRGPGKPDRQAVVKLALDVP